MIQPEPDGLVRGREERRMYPGTLAAAHPDRPAVVMAESGEQRTYAELDDRSARLATALRAQGVRPGATVLLVLDNDVRWGEVAWACWRSGLHLGAVAAHATVAELVPLLADADPAVVVARRSRLADLRAAATRAGVEPAVWLAVRDVPDGATGPDADLDALVEATPRDPHLVETAGGRLLFSSGTTGRPKAFRVDPVDVHPARVGVRSADLMRALGFDDTGNVLLVAGPAYHAGPLGFLQSVHQLGGTVVLMRRFDPLAALAAIERHRVTHSQWVPTMFVRLLRLSAEERGRHDLSTHRVAVHAAAPCPPDVKRAMLDWWGPVVHEYYGASEGYGRTTIGPEDWLRHPGSVGRATGSRVAVADEAGRLLPAGGIGRVWFARPDAADPVDGHLPVDRTGWGAVGDLGYLDGDDYLHLTGRVGHTIISGGVNVYPREVEDALALHPAVADVAVLGVPDEEFGERVLAVVVPLGGVPVADPAVLEQQLAEHCATRLAGPRRPRAWEFVAALPRSDAGKVRLPELRRQFVPTAGGEG